MVGRFAVFRAAIRLNLNHQGVIHQCPVAFGTGAQQTQFTQAFEPSFTVVAGAGLVDQGVQKSQITQSEQFGVEQFAGQFGNGLCV